MIIPEKIKAGAHTYDVIHAKTRDETKGNGWGKTHRADLKIWLDEALPRTRLEETFMHELMHVVYDMACLNAVVEKMEEEEIVNRLSQYLYLLLKENDMLK